MDTGLNTLVAIARFYTLSVKPEQIARVFSRTGCTFADSKLFQGVKVLNLRAKRLTQSPNVPDKSALLMLITPHFFQVVMANILIHRGSRLYSHSRVMTMV
jgi:hypothetical protein